jgi:hypothetical protein
MSNVNPEDAFKPDRLFDLPDADTEVPDSNADAYEKLKRLSTPGDEPDRMMATEGFPEERTLGDYPNVYTPDEGEKIISLTTNGVPYEKAFIQATGRKYVPPPKDKPIYDERAPYRPHPIRPSSKLKGIADERSAEDPWLR